MSHSKLRAFGRVFTKKDGLKDFVFPEMPSQLTLLDFAKRETFDKVFTTSDASLGGFSTAHLDPYYEGEGLSKRLVGHFHGNLNLNLPPANKKVKDSGWSMWKTRDRVKDGQFKLFYVADRFRNYWWDWNPYSTLALRVRSPTPHRKFFVNVQLDTMSRVDLFQHRLFLDPRSTDWQLILIPLDDFVMTNRGKVLSQVNGSMMKDRVKSIGLSILDRKFGEFQLFIDKIEVVADETYIRRIDQARGDPKQALTYDEEQQIAAMLAENNSRILKDAKQLASNQSNKEEENVLPDEDSGLAQLRKEIEDSLNKDMTKKRKAEQDKLTRKRKIIE